MFNSKRVRRKVSKDREEEFGEIQPLRDALKLNEGISETMNGARQISIRIKSKNISEGIKRSEDG